MLDRRYEKRFGRRQLLEQLLGSAPVRTPVFALADLRRFLLSLAGDPWARQTGVTLGSVSRAIGKDVTSVHRYLRQRRKQETEYLIGPIADVVKALDTGELCFVRLPHRWHAATHTWLVRPPGRPRKQAVIVPIVQWNYWARCDRCGHRRFMRCDDGNAVCSYCVTDPRELGTKWAREPLPVPTEAELVVFGRNA